MMKDMCLQNLYGGFGNISKAFLWRHQSHRTIVLSEHSINRSASTQQKLNRKRLRIPYGDVLRRRFK